MKAKDTGLICGNAQPIYVGDRFSVKRHFNECCNHYVDCEVREDPKCRSGYGLYEIKTGEFIVNAEIANDRID